MRRSPAQQTEAKKPPLFTYTVKKAFYRYGRPVNPEDPEIKKNGVKMSKETARFLVANGTLELHEDKSAAEKPKGK
jgi:hypothetical protein